MRLRNRYRSALINLYCLKMRQPKVVIIAAAGPYLLLLSNSYAERVATDLLIKLNVRPDFRSAIEYDMKIETNIVSSLIKPPGLRIRGLVVKQELTPNWVFCNS
jgi:hypothetical protein